MSEGTVATSSKEHAFVSRLKDLFQRDSGDGRAARAALRTGVGKEPGEAPRMLPYLARFLTANSGPGVRAMFLTASLYASHPEQREDVSLGKALRQAVKEKHGEAGVERRWTAAMDAHPDDLPRHIEGLVGLCESAGVGLDWHRFYGDMWTLLGDDEEWRTKVWMRLARDFWQRAADDDAQKDED